MSVIITTLVASILNFNFLFAIHRSFSIVKGAEGAQIRTVFANRKSALKEIARQASRITHSIDVLSISGSSFLQPDNDVLKEIARRCEHKSRTDVRVLLLDPRTRFAVERSLREEGEEFPSVNPDSFQYSNKKLCFDTFLALHQLNTILEDAENSGSSDFSLSIRLYSYPPMVLYIRLDNRIFAEQYHYGIPSEQVRRKFTKCLGKEVPVLESNRNSELGHILDSHFEYIWGQSVNHELRVGSYIAIQEAMRETDWVDHFLNQYSEEEALWKVKQEQKPIEQPGPTVGSES